MSYARVGSLLLLVAMLAPVAGCGDKKDSAATPSPTMPSGMVMPSASRMPSTMPMPSGTALNDPAATPADKVVGAALRRGTFVLLDTRPPGMDHVAGTAALAQNAQGTTVTVNLTGLKPAGMYMAHLHAQPCATANGGPHFQFKAGGPTSPPNEVHMMFIADGAGKGAATVHNPGKVGAGARSLVVHPMEAMDNRLACVDF